MRLDYKSPVRSAVMLGACLLFTALSALAQGRTDGSIYSRFGLGELYTYSSSQMQAMGGGGVASHSLNYSTFINPASWGDQVVTRASMGFLLQSVSATDAADNTSSVSSGNLNAIQFSFPLYDRRMGVAVGFAPFSRVSHNVRQDGSLVTNPDDGTETDYSIFFEGSGGLQSITAGLGYRFGPHLSLGANADFIFGILRESQRTRFVGGDFAETVISTSTRLVGATGTVGVLASFQDLLREDDDFSVGATITLPTTLSGDRVNTLGESTAGDTLGTTRTGSIDLPLRLRAGVAYAFSDRVNMVSDVLFEPWSNFESEFSLPGYAPNGINLFKDRIRASAGIEFLPAGNDFFASKLARITYRLGFYVDQSYVSPTLDQDLQTLAVTAGFGIPAITPGTRVDINFELGTRGTTDDNLVRDTFFRFAINANVGERWFQRQKLR